MKEIDLIIPVYGSAPFFQKTLHSLDSSDLDYINTIIVLDRPSDETRELSRISRSEIDGCRIIESGDPGIVAALNLGIGMSDAKYIARLDSDDLVSPKRFRIQKDFLDSQSEVAVVGSQMKLIDFEDQAIGSTAYPTKFKDINELMEFQNCIAHPSIMMRRDLFEQTGGYKKCFTGAEDYDLWMRMAKLGELRNLENQLTYYRISPNQFSRSATANPGIVEIAVKLSNMGYAPKGFSETVQPSRRSLEESNRANMETLKRESINVWRRIRLAEEINLIWVNRGSARNASGKLVVKLLKALVLDGPLTLRYVSLKIRFNNLGKS